MKSHLFLRTIVIALLFCLLPALAAAEHNPSIDENTSTPALSVMEVPAVEGSDTAQVAVKWSGELPARLQAGTRGPNGEFQALGQPVRLSQSMSLLPRPDTGPSDDLLWRVLDRHGEILARSARSSVQPGWQPTFHREGLSEGGIAYAFVEFQGEDSILGSVVATAFGHRIAKDCGDGLNVNEWKRTHCAS